MRRSFSAGALLLAVGCLDAKDSALFIAGGPSAGGAAGGAASSAGAGTASGSSPLVGGSVSGGSTSGSAGAGGDLPLPTSAAGAGGAAGDARGGSSAGGALPVVTDCAMLNGAVKSASGHCYRVDYQNLDFRSARDACQAAGGHLVSIGSAEENRYVADLHDGEHWLGATDGRADTEAGPGPYAWTSGEGWTYSDWEQGQPNAYETDCPLPGDDDRDCFEHCAFQTDEGDWNDRSCWHTIVSVCEWDLDADEAGAGGAGAAAAR